jgi:transitional endoplasmic reticulum ATPase
MAELKPSVDALLAAGQRAIEARDWRGARKSLGKVVHLDPHSVEGQFWLGVALYHLGRCREAEEHLRWVSRQGRPPLPDRPAAVWEYLSRCHITSNTDKAISFAQRGVDNDPRDARIRYILGNALSRQQRREEALTHYREASECEGAEPAFPHHPGLVPFALSSVLVDMKKWREASKAIRKAIEREPGQALYHNRYSVILFEGLGQPEDAVEAVLQAIQLDPGTQATGFDGIYHYNHALYLKALGRYAEALIAIENAINISPQQTYKALRSDLANLVPNETTVVVPKAAASRIVSRVPEAGRLDFTDVGGMQTLKDQVRRILDVLHTNRAHARRYGIVRNGILLYGPPGCGKTFFAEAIAGEFGLSFLRVPLGAAQSQFIGGAAKGIEAVFRSARSQAPCLLFFDEFDAVAGKRNDAATQHEAQMVNALLQQIDAHRDVPGIVLAAATNRLDDIDSAAIREGRFDYKVRIPKPDFDARREILQVLLRDRPHDPGLDVTELAQDMDGFTAAQVRHVVDEAAMLALEGDSPIAEGHLAEAYEKHITRRKFDGKGLAWDELILPGETKRRLQFIEQFLENPELAAKLGIDMPSGLLLFGPPGTGKTTIARVLASQTDASFFAINASDVFSKWFGESEQKMKELFEKARDSVPAIVFIDEADAVLGTRQGGASGGDAARNSTLNTFLAEMDGIEHNGRIFVVGATNRPDLIDEAVLRPGRMSEAIEIGVPDTAGRRALLELFSAEMPIDESVDLDEIAAQTEGTSGADLKGLCTSAGRQAFLRELEEQDDEQVVTREDFEAALNELFPERAWSPDQRTIGF